jgi:hypothetical protein
VEAWCAVHRRSRTGEHHNINRYTEPGTPSKYHIRTEPIWKRSENNNYTSKVSGRTQERQQRQKPTANNSIIQGKNHPEITQDDVIISTSNANSTPQKKGQNVLNKVKTRKNRNTETQRVHPKKNPTIDHQTC